MLFSIDTYAEGERFHTCLIIEEIFKLKSLILI